MLLVPKFTVEPDTSPMTSTHTAPPNADEKAAMAELLTKLPL